MGSKSQQDSPSTTVILGGLTDVGRRRDNNQDSMCSLAAPNTQAGVTALVAVADGMGGHKGGDVASALAIDGVVARLGRNSKIDFPTSDRIRLMTDVILQIHADVAKAGAAPELSGMGTTLSIAVIENDHMVIGHVGDSRIYMLRNEKLTQLTPDHSWVAEEVRRGNITQAEADVHPRRNLVAQAIGATPSIEPMVGQFPVAIGDKILLCSDGLHGPLSNEEIRLLVGSLPPDVAVRSLIDKANDAGGPDNITAVIAEIAKAPDSATRTRLSEMSTMTSSSRTLSLILRVITWPARIVFRVLRRLFRRK